MIIGDNKTTGKTFALMLVDIRNLGTPSVAVGWRLSIKLSSESILTSNPSLIPDNFELREEGKKLAKFNQTHRLEEKAMTPIQQGALMSGWLKLDFPNINPEQFSKAIKTLYVQDILRKEYSTTSDPRFHREEPLGKSYFPGSGDNPVRIIPNEK